MVPLAQLPMRFVPDKDVLDVLNTRPWICCYSGGKDSTSLVTWIEWLRRVGMVRVSQPRLVMSDTRVEYPFLQRVSAAVMNALTQSGWQCEVVTPRIHERLYNRIFGIGNVPVHPGARKRMRWCTARTKIDPMKRYAHSIDPDMLQLTGVRYGESKTRDEKLKPQGCSAGGECGMPEPRKDVYGPIINWTLCKVIEWLEGAHAAAEVLPDLIPHVRDQVTIYDVRRDAPGLFDVPPKYASLRFGCVGCPAITRSRVIAGQKGQADPRLNELKRLWIMWQELYLRPNRCCRIKAEPTIRKGPKPTWSEYHVGFGPLRMAARQQYFPVLLDIQAKAGVTLVTAEDEAFIRQCWAEKRYPRGWSEADEATVPPEEGLFGEYTEKAR